ncbi:MAG: GNAT family N-acetyltransferase [Desulfovermiculus sp.]
MEQRLSTPSGDFCIRPYAPEDESGVLALWREAFGYEMPDATWDWKFRSNPFGRQIMLCVHENTTPVVMFAGLPYPATCKGKDVLVTHAVDNMSHPQFRGALSGKKGLFVQTAEAFFRFYAGPEGSAFVYGLPGQRHFRLGRIMLKYSELPGGIAYLEADPRDVIGRFRPFCGRIRQVKPDHQSFDHLMQKLPAEYPFFVQRGSQFMQWRFGLHPVYRYEMWTAYSFAGLRPKGYAVVRIEDDQAVIVDMMLERNQKTVNDFWARLARQLAEKGIQKVKTWLPGGHFQVHILLECGFVLQPEPLGFVPAAVERTFDPKLDFSWAARNIYYTMADGDVL